jgi:hypothetical protein
MNSKASRGLFGELKHQTAITDHLEKEKQVGKIALSQNTSLDGVMQSDGEHDLCTCHGGRVMRTLGINSREGLRPILRPN